MQFLKTLFWVVLAVAVVLFARDNWVPVTISLWSGIQADVKLPVLVGFAFLLGFVPTYLVLKGRIWTLSRRVGQQVRRNVANQPAAPSASAAPDPAPAPTSADVVELEKPASPAA